MMDIKVLDIIIAFVKGIKDHPKENKNAPHHYIDDGTNTLWAAGYLLNQILRQYKIPKNHTYVSVKAQEKWNELTDQKIEDYTYTKGVPLKCDAILDLYKGAEENPTDKGKPFSKGSKFKYRQVFHDEHIIPISMVIEKLINLETLDHHSVQKVINNIYICKMLKTENINLNKKFKTTRDWDFEKTKNEIYKAVGIEMLPISL